MDPRPDHQLLALAREVAAALGAHADEILDRAVHEHVVPAAEVESRHLHLVVASANRPLLPVVVPGVVLDPVVEVGRDLGPIRRQPWIVLDRQEFVGGPEIADRLVHAVDGRLVAQAPRAGEGDGDQRPGFFEGERPRASFITPAVVVVGRGHRRHDRNQGRRLQRRRHPLRGPDIGEAVHADLAVGTGQLGRPLDGVVAVLGFVAEGIERALGGVLAAYVLDHDDVAVRGVELRWRIDVGLGRVLVVGQAHEDDGIAAGELGAIDVGVERDPVAHLGGDVQLFLRLAGTVGRARGRDGSEGGETRRGKSNAEPA